MTTEDRTPPPWWVRQAAMVDERKKAGYVFMPAKKIAGYLSPVTSGSWVFVQVPLAGTSSDVQLHEDAPLSPEEEEELAAAAGPRWVDRELF